MVSQNRTFVMHTFRDLRHDKGFVEIILLQGLNFCYFGITKTDTGGRLKSIISDGSFVLIFDVCIIYSGFQLFLLQSITNSIAT